MGLVQRGDVRFYWMWVTTAAIGCSMSAISGAQEYTLEVLDTGNYTSTFPMAASADGRRVVGYGQAPVGSASDWEALLWADGRLVVLHPEGAEFSMASGISDDGRVQSGSVSFTGSQPYQKYFAVWGSSLSSLRYWGNEEDGRHPVDLSGNGSRIATQRLYGGTELWFSPTASIFAPFANSFYPVCMSASGDLVAGGWLHSGTGHSLAGYLDYQDRTQHWLHPSGHMSSKISGMSADGALQVGIVAPQSNNYVPRPAIWKGTVESFSPIEMTGWESGDNIEISPNGKFIAYRLDSAFGSEIRLLNREDQTTTPLNSFFPTSLMVIIAVTDNGDVVGILNDPPHRAAILRRSAWVRIDRAEMVSKNTFEVQVSSHLKSGSASLSMAFEINGRPIHEAQPSISTGERLIYRYNLADLGVPRFTGHQRFQINVSVESANHGSATASREVFIPLPVVNVNGIKPYAIGQGDDEGFEAAMREKGYQTDDSPSNRYPTLYGLEYFPDDQPLSVNASFLEDQVAEAIEKTYASKVDIVAHSKGGLVARQWIKDFPLAKPRLRKLIMAASPHTGAAASLYAHGLATIAMPWRAPVYRELFPTWPWYRNSASEPFGHYGESNGTLISLNNSFSLTGVSYWLLYGSGFTTYSNYSGILAGYGTADGDGLQIDLGSDLELPFGVMAWSAQGYEVTCDTNGAVSQGNVIPAFQAQPPVVPPLALELQHCGYLAQAVPQVFFILND